MSVESRKPTSSASGRTRAYLPFALVAIVALLILGSWIYRERSARHDAAFAASKEAREQPANGDAAGRRAADSGTKSESLSPRSTVAVDDAPVAAARKSVEQVLSEYWGDRWPEMKARIQAACELEGRADCLAQLVDGEIPPWESVAAEMEQGLLATRAPRMGLAPDSVTADSIRQSIPGAKDIAWDEGRLESVREILRRRSPELTFWQDAYNNALRAAIDSQWRSGNYERGPLVLPSVGVPGTFAISQRVGNWVGVVHLHYAEHPRLAEAEEELRKLRDAGSAEISAYLATLR